MPSNDELKQTLQAAVGPYLKAFCEDPAGATLEVTATEKDVWGKLKASGGDAARLRENLDNASSFTETFNFLAERLDKNRGAHGVAIVGAQDVLGPQPEGVTREGGPPVPAPPQGQSYGFEAARASTRRRDVASAYRVFCRRLNIAPAAVGAHRALLLKYCVAYPLNIAWYDRRRAEEERKATTQRRFIVAVGLVLLVATLAAPLLAWKLSGADSAVSNQLIVSLVGLLVGGAFTALKLLATGFDATTRMGIFWKAGADLKEALYAFEETWADKAVSERTLSAEFVAAVEVAVVKGRGISNDERRAFFATYKSPADLLSVVSGSIDGAKQARADLLGALAETAKARDAAGEKREKALDDARAAWVKAVAALTGKQVAWEQADAGGKQAAKAALVAATAAEAEARKALELLQG